MMKQPTASDALRLFLIASVGLAPFACGGSATSGGGSSGDGDSGGDGDGDIAGDGDTSGDGDGDTPAGDGDGDTPVGDGDGDLSIDTCTGAAPIVGGVDTGTFRCNEGVIHRREPGECPSSLPRSTVLEPVGPTGLGGADNGGLSDQCSTDSDCEGDYAYCGVTWGGFGTPYLACLHGCATDADCGDRYLCLCGEEFGTCQPMAGPVESGGCRSDVDCVGDELCVGVRWTQICGGSLYEFGCTPFDAGCGDSFCDNECAWVEDEVVCQHNGDCGRPFLVEGDKRLAAVRGRTDWCCRSDDVRSDFRASERERVVAAAHFERVALMEHASIAAFARFSLQLLSLGAPAEFIEETNQALVDETKHARLAFSLASRFIGRSVGPGPLRVDRALEQNSAESTLTTTIIEGCIGETMAALEARAALRECRDAEVRVALEQIAADEERHASLAWKMVRWMIEQRPELGRVAEQVFADAATAHTAGTGRGEGAPALGVLSDAEIERVQRDALDNVVVPCARLLFDGVRVGVPGASVELPQLTSLEER